MKLNEIKDIIKKLEWHNFGGSSGGRVFKLVGDVRIIILIRPRGSDRLILNAGGCLMGVAKRYAEVLGKKNEFFHVRSKEWIVTANEGKVLIDNIVERVVCEIESWITDYNYHIAEKSFAEKIPGYLSAQFFHLALLSYNDEKERLRNYLELMREDQSPFAVALERKIVERALKFSAKQ